jgi:hypothetical protein
LEVTTIRFHAGEIEVQQALIRRTMFAKVSLVLMGNSETSPRVQGSLGNFQLVGGECGTSGTRPAPLAGKLKNRRQVIPIIFMAGGVEKWHR